MSEFPDMSRNDTLMVHRVYQHWDDIPPTQNSNPLSLLPPCPFLPPPPDLLRLLSQVGRHFLAAAFSLRVSRSFDAARLVTLACLVALADAVMRVVATGGPPAGRVAGSVATVRARPHWALKRVGPPKMYATPRTDELKPNAKQRVAQIGVNTACVVR